MSGPAPSLPTEIARGATTEPRWAVNAEAVEATRVVVEAARRCISRMGGDVVRALVLTGSVARGEATVVRHAGELVMLGDAEFLLVPAASARASGGIESAVRREIEEAARRRGLRCAVDIALVPPEFFRTLPAHIFTYELRAFGQVVWGDRSVLAPIPRVAADDIDREDAWRLLANRIIEQLEASGTAEPGEALRLPRVDYHAAKLWLDMATSLLVFTGDYAPTYRQRAESLRLLAARVPDGMPFSLSDFASRVTECTRWKLGAGEPPWRPGVLAGEARPYAHRLWRWELQQLTGLRDVLDERVLMARWMSAQPWRARARGWLSAGRRSGGFAGWRRWSRFLRLARRSSPRYLVYAAAAELFFAPLPAGGSADLAALARRLPLDVCGRAAAPRALAEGIARNYRGLLVGTRT